MTMLLKKRFDLGLNGFIFLPCELIEKNGQTLKKYVLEYAKLWNLGTDFEKWVGNKNIFCNTLVDRIVTGYPRDEKIDLGYEGNMLDTSEIFHLWVIEAKDDEQKSLKNEFPFEKAELNIIVTDNLDRYRTRKVRILERRAYVYDSVCTAFKNRNGRRMYEGRENEQICQRMCFR